MDPGLHHGKVDDELGRELPGLRLVFTVLDARPGRSAVSLRHRLRDLSDGPRGGGVVAMRTHAIPQAYRALFRQIGLDPDVTRPPRERVAVERLIDGRYRSRGLPHDALLIALLETGVATWALDAARVDEVSLGLRASRAGEQLMMEGLARELPERRLVVADDLSVHSVLFGEQDQRSAVNPRTRRMVLYAVGVDGVPEIHLHESIWMAADLMAV